MIRSRGELLDDQTRRVEFDAAPSDQIVQQGQIGEAATRMMIVKEVFDDYLRCRSWNGVAEGTVDSKVAKPWQLRLSTWDGQTIAGISYTRTGVQNRDAVSGATTQNEEITTPYLIPAGGFAGELIVVERMRQWTGVTVSGHKLYLEDTNRGAKAWAKVTSP